MASDQAYREADLAIDFCEDVPALPMTRVEKLFSCFESAGAKVKISSIHVNGWFGDYDKLTMTGVMFEEVFGQRLEDVKERVILYGRLAQRRAHVYLFSTFGRCGQCFTIQRHDGSFSRLGDKDGRGVWIFRDGGYSSFLKKSFGCILMILRTYQD